MSGLQGRMAEPFGRAGKALAICESGFSSLCLVLSGNHLPPLCSEGLGRYLKLSMWLQSFPQGFLLCPEVHIAVLNLATFKALCNPGRFIFPTLAPVWDLGTSQNLFGRGRTGMVRRGIRGGKTPSSPHQTPLRTHPIS